MDATAKRFYGLKVLVATAAFFIVVAGLKAAQGILIPFMFALFLAILGSPAVIFLKRLRFPTIAAVFLVTIIIVGALVGVAAILGTSVNALTSSMPEYRVQFNQLAADIDAKLKESETLEAGVKVLVGSVNPSAVFDVMGAFLKGLLGALRGALLMIFIMIFVMFEAAEFQKKLKLALGSSVDMSRFSGITQDVQRYLAIKTFTSILTGVLVTLWVGYRGVDFPALWGLIAFLMNFIPYIGSLLAAIPAIILTLVLFGWSAALILAVGYIVVNIGISNFIEPVLFGRRLGLSPLIVFLSLVFWGYVWGPAGMLIAVPLTMLALILLEHSEDLSWVAVLMSAKSSHPPPNTAAD